MEMLTTMTEYLNFARKVFSMDIKMFAKVGEKFTFPGIVETRYIIEIKIKFSRQ